MTLIFKEDNVLYFLIMMMTMLPSSIAGMIDAQAMAH